MSSKANSDHQYFQPGKKYGCSLHIVPSNEEAAGGHVRVLSNRNGLVIEVEELPHQSLHRGVPLAAPAEITHIKKFNIQKSRHSSITAPPTATWPLSLAVTAWRNDCCCCTLYTVQYTLLLVESETWMMCIEKGKSSPLERSTIALTLSVSCRPGTAL